MKAQPGSPLAEVRVVEFEGIGPGSRTPWCDLLEGSDVCFAPVLSMAEARAHPHNVARGIDGIAEDGAVTAHGAPRQFSLGHLVAD